VIKKRKSIGLGAAKSGVRILTGAGKQRAGTFDRNSGADCFFACGVGDVDDEPTYLFRNVS